MNNFWKELMHLRLISLCGKVRDIEKSKESFPHWIKDNEANCKRIEKCLNGLCQNIVDEYTNDIAERLDKLDKDYYVVRKASPAGRYISESMKNGKELREAG